MTFTFGEKSLKAMEGVHPSIVAVVKSALEISTQDFGVHGEAAGTDRFGKSSTQ